VSPPRSAGADAFPALIGAELRNLGVPVGELRVIHRGGSVVLSDDTIVVRLGPEDHEETSATLRLVGALELADAPVLTPLLPSPLRTRFGVVTVWPRAEPSAHPYEDLGRALHDLHEKGPVSLLRRGEDTRTGLRRRVRRLGSGQAPEGIVRWLMRALAELPEKASWDDDGVLLHGDAHPGNVLRLRGRAVLSDMGTARTGPASLDLVPAWCDARRGRRGWMVWREFKNGYAAGAAEELAAWEHLGEAVHEREITTTVFLAERLRDDPALLEELELRRRSWDRPGDGERWNCGH